MNVELTIKDKGGLVICKNERYDLEELKHSPAFSAEERSQMDVFYVGQDATTIFRGDSQFILVRA